MVTRYLVWDGEYSYNGDSIKSQIADLRQVPRKRRRFQFARGRNANAVKTANPISIEITEIRQIIPFTNLASFKVEIENIDRIRSMMVRVYRRSDEPVAEPSYDALVYQEVLDQNHVASLPTADPTVDEDGGPKLVDDAAAELRRQRCAYGNGLHRLDGPYQVVVWISRENDAFASFINSEAVQGAGRWEGYGDDQHHSRWGPLARMDEAFLNLREDTNPFSIAGRRVCNSPDNPVLELIAGPPVIPHLRALICNVYTGYPHTVVARTIGGDSLFPSFDETFPVDIRGSYNDLLGGAIAEDATIADRATWIRARLASCDAGMNDAHFDIFVLPEWFWRRPFGFPHSPADLQEIKVALAAISQDMPRVILFGGSVYWRQGGQEAQGAQEGQGGQEGQEAQEAQEAQEFRTYNTLLVYFNNELVLEFDKVVNSDTMCSTPIRSREKELQGVADSAWQQEAWASYKECDLEKKPALTAPALTAEQRMTLLDWTPIRARAQAGISRFPFFVCRLDGQDVCFGVDICADHSVSLAKKLYARRHPAGRGVDVHVLVSASILPIAKNTCTREGGYLLHCDGNNENATQVNNSFLGAALGRANARVSPIAASLIRLDGKDAIALNYLSITHVNGSGPLDSATRCFASDDVIDLNGPEAGAQNH